MNTNTDNRYTIFVVDKSGSVMAHQDPKRIDTNMSAELYIREILNSGKKSDHFTTEISGSQFHISYLTSDIWGWTFINIGKKQDILSKLYLLQRDVLVTTAIFIIVAVSVGLFFTSNIYRPIRRLTRKIRTSSNPDINVKIIGETALLEKAYDTLVENMQDMNKALPAKRNEVLRQIILGTYISEGEMKKEVDKLHMDLQAVGYLVCILKMDDYRGILQRKSKFDISLLLFAMSNIAYEVFSASFLVQVVQIDSDHICVIVNLDSDTKVDTGEMEAALQRVQFLIHQYYHISCTGAKGKYVTGIEDISDSYRSALEASQYRILYGRQSIIRYADIADLYVRSYEYPASIETKLINELKLGNEAGVKRELDHFIKEISDFSYEGILLSLTHLTVVSVQMIKMIIDVEKYGMDVSYKTIQEKLQSLDTIEAIRDWFFSLYANVIALSQNRQESKKGDFVKSILQFIHEHYSNENLSLQMIAEYVQLSPNYVRVTFKDLTNQSISDYINSMRFEKAGDLLRNTDHTAAKISALVGFSNSNYFYTSFKKFMGKTPDQYRKDYLK